jgi:hypothetical protein
VGVAAQPPAHCPGLGIGLANIRGDDISTRIRDEVLTRHVLRVGVMLLGLRLPLSELSQIGVRGAITVIGSSPSRSQPPGASVDASDSTVAWWS